MLAREISNDPRIAADEVLFRGLHPSWIVPGDSGEMRIASAAFKHYELSVFVRSILVGEGRTEQDALAACPKEHEALCSITAGLAHGLKQEVRLDSDPPHDTAHGLVVGKKTQAVANKMAREARWVIPAEPPSIG